MLGEIPVNGTGLKELNSALARSQEVKDQYFLCRIRYPRYSALVM
jgi:hypothetical protein